VSNGCIRLPNPTLSRLFKVVPPGTQVIIHP
jgi:lipoprotein-anchoring transpeptidase ErfK/SrfK